MRLRGSRQVLRGAEAGVLLGAALATGCADPSACTDALMNLAPAPVVAGAACDADEPRPLVVLRASF